MPMPLLPDNWHEMNVIVPQDAALPIQILEDGLEDVPLDVEDPHARLFFRIEVVCIFDGLDAVTNIMPRPGVENSISDATCDVPR